MLLAPHGHLRLTAASLLLAVTVLSPLLGCSNVATKGSGNADGGGARENPVESTGGAGSDGQSSAGDKGTDPETAGGSKPPGRIDGPIATKPPAAGGSCSSNDDCSADQVCEGKGCDAGAGVCQPKQRMCTRDLRQYCGCDGKTFEGSGSCPGARFSAEGACTPQ